MVRWIAAWSMDLRRNIFLRYLYHYAKIEKKKYTSKSNSFDKNILKYGYNESCGLLNFIHKDVHKSVSKWQVF